MRVLHFQTVIAALTLTLLLAPISPSFQRLCPSAFAEELWKQEFLDLCSKTDEAMSLSKEELAALLQRGEKLKPAIESLEETPRKVYLKRLQMCINLFSFVLESRAAGRKP